MFDMFDMNILFDRSRVSKMSWITNDPTRLRKALKGQCDQQENYQQKAPSQIGQSKLKCINIAKVSSIPRMTVKRNMVPKRSRKKPGTGKPNCGMKENLSVVTIAGIIPNLHSKVQFTSSHFPVPSTLADQINLLLPQTQCTKCGYPSCRDYAQAIATEQAPHNQCPPGGQEGVRRLALLLNREEIPLNTDHGRERRRPLALIDAARCIGCTLCIQACPVDAIMGMAKKMHTVIPDLCTGCDLCLAPCPVDCIAMIETGQETTGWAAWSGDQAQAARSRYETREKRLLREKNENDARLLAKAEEKLKLLNAETRAALDSAQVQEQTRKRMIIAEAIARAQNKAK